MKTLVLINIKITVNTNPKYINTGTCNRVGRGGGKMGKTPVFLDDTIHTWFTEFLYDWL